MEKDGSWYLNDNGVKKKAVDPGAFTGTKISGLVQFFREGKRKDNPGVGDRLAWTRVGYNGDFAAASGAKYNDIILPSKTLLDKPMTFRFGLDAEAKKFIYEKKIPLP